VKEFVLVGVGSGKRIKAIDSPIIITAIAVNPQGDPSLYFFIPDLIGSGYGFGQNKLGYGKLEKGSGQTGGNDRSGNFF